MKVTQKHFLLLPVVALGMTTSCKNNGLNKSNNVAQQTPIKYIDSANFDVSVSPGENFFKFANGSWIKNTKMPGDKSRWGSFDELAEKTDESVKTVLESASAKSNDINESLVANFYKSGMDSTAINSKGLKAIDPLLTAVNNVSNVEQLLDLIIVNTKQGLGTVLGLSIEPDDKNVNNLIVKFYQDGIGLPNKDYYTDKDPNSQSIRDEYKAYIAKILQFSGQDEATAKVNAEKVFALEDKMAQSMLRQQEMRDPVALYNKFKVDDFSKQTPNLNWIQILEKLGIPHQDSFIIATPKFYNALSKLIVSEPLDVWKNYMTFQTITSMATYLNDEVNNVAFDFYGKKLKGQKEQQPRWKRVKNVINGTIGESMGQLYVKKYFKPEAKEKMVSLVSNLQSAFAERIQALDWMSDATKQKALAKLNSFTKKIGYPDKWKDYSKLAISKDNYAQNVLNSFAFHYNQEINKLGKPVDKTEWFMTPNTVNAYYNPAFNEIVFPAAILQFPFFDFGADDAINYGGIGAVIGHEMTHGFDDQGAQYAADGNLSDWWTPEDKKKFQAKTAVLVKQYNDFTVLDSLHVNGAMTLGENIADLGGVAIAYQAFKKTKQGQSNELIDGFTPDQRFFLSWAQVWRGIATPEYTVQLLKTDFHSPGEARANIPLSNFEPFYKAFNVKEGDKMYRSESERAKIW